MFESKYHMNAEQLKQLLEQVAIVVDGNLVGSTGQISKKKVNRKPRIIRETIINEDGEEEQIEIEEPNHNPTLGYVVVGLKENYRACELGCGAIISNQVIERRLVTTPVKHWRNYCKSCHKSQGPDNTMMNSAQAQQAFSKWFRSEQDK